MSKVVALAIGVLLVAGCGSSTEPDARTYYESLDLSSPEATVGTFVEAFARDDFMTVWFTFDWHTQNEIRQSFELLQYSKLVDTNEIPSPGVTITDPIADLVGRGNLDRWRVFDQLMLVADEYDAFLIPITQLTSWERRGVAAAGTASVAVTVEGSDEELIINLRQGEEDRWFIEQVIAPGGDTQQIPWSVRPQQ